MTTRLRSDTSQAAIFARLWDSHDHGFTPELARHVLKLAFADQDLQLMHELASKNQEGRLSKDERQALDNYITVGDLLAIVQSKAREFLKQMRATNNRHG
jgi:hypothetical protein